MGTPRPSPSVPEAGSSIAAPFGARALATGAWFWAPRRSVLATPIARAAPVAKSALSGAHSALKAPVSQKAAAAHRVAVAAGALACPFRPSWRCQAGAAADHPEPGRCKVARFFLAVQHRP